MPLPRPPSAFARQTIRKSYEELDKTLSPIHSRDFKLISLDDVRKSATALQEQLAARQSLRNMRRLLPLFDVLERFSKVADSLCSGTPYLQLIWAPIKEILRASSEFVDAFDKIIGGYSELALSLQSFQLLGATFKDDSIFQDTLAIIYTNILEFHKHAYRYVHKNGWKLLFMSSWSSFGTRLNGILEDLKKHRELVEFQASARNISEAQKMRDDVRLWREEYLEGLKRDEMEKSAQDFLAIMSALKIDEQDQLSIFHEVFSEGEKYVGTCTWATLNPTMKTWLRKTQETPLMWLHGSPGTGKSILSAQLVTYLRAAQAHVIHHFCTYLYDSSTKLDQILRSILIQLLRIDPELVAHVYHLFIQQKKPPTIHGLEQLLLSLLEGVTKQSASAGYIWVVLDGVDECHQENQSRLLRLIRQFAIKSSSWGDVTIKVLISSRSSPSLSGNMRLFQRLSLTDETKQLGKAIRTYSMQRLRKVQDRLAQVGITDEDFTGLADAVANRADGMFLYARLVLDYISTKIFLSPGEVKSSVEGLPKKITDFYQQILSQTLRRDEQSIDRIRCVLGWVAFARRPLRRLELLSAVAFSDQQTAVDRVAPKYLLDDCASLIVERGDTTLAFIHVSVKDFLQESSIGLRISAQDIVREHCRAAICCLVSGLTVFSPDYEEEKRNIRVVKGVHGFHVYATEHWVNELLLVASAAKSFDHGTLELAQGLASRIEEVYGAVVLPSSVEADMQMRDERIASLKQSPGVYRCVLNALVAASLEKLESRMISSEAVAPSGAESGVEDLNSGNLETRDGTSKLLESYQQTTRFLLDQKVVDGVSAEDLRLFKEQFASSAFTCSMRSCPRATIGFESEKDLREHEMAHAQGYRCCAPGCRYPPFGSLQRLKSHVRDSHLPAQVRKTIRQAGTPTRDGQSETFRATNKEIKVSSVPEVSTSASPFVDGGDDVSYLSVGKGYTLNSEVNDLALLNHFAISSVDNDYHYSLWSQKGNALDPNTSGRPAPSEYTHLPRSNHHSAAQNSRPYQVEATPIFDSHVKVPEWLDNPSPITSEIVTHGKVQLLWANGQSYIQ